MKTYEIRQFIRTVEKGWLETVYTTDIERIAKDAFRVYSRENPDKHFELYEINHEEKCLLFTEKT